MVGGMFFVFVIVGHKSIGTEYERRNIREIHFLLSDFHCRVHSRKALLRRQCSLMSARDG